MYGSWVRVPAGSLQSPDFYSWGFYFMPYLYIIYSEKLNKYYVGAYIDLERRLYEHNIGHAKFTSTGIKSRKYIEALI